MSAAIAGGARFIVLSDRDSGRDLAPIPSLLLTSRGAPPPDPGEDPHPGRPARRGRRRPRGAPRRAAHRLRRGRGQPVPGDGDRRGPGPPRRARPGVTRREGRRQPHQGARQGRAQDHVARWASRPSRPTAARRSSRRSACRQELVDAYFTGTVTQLGGVGLDVIAAEVAARHAAAYPPDGRPRRRTAARRSAASTSGVARASRTCSTRRRSSGCSTPPAQRRYDIFQRVHRRVDEQAERLMTLRGLFALRGPAATAGAARRGRAGQRDRQAVRHRRDELRLDLPGGARDARHRDEPDRRPVQHRRGRRGRRPAARPGAPLARSSRSPPAGSA